MAARTKARKRAVDLLYESDLRGSDALTVVAERVAMADPPVNDYTIELIEGVTANRRRIDALLSEYSEGWTIERMPDVDRAILRVGVYELLWATVPDAVAIDEAVELAKSLSTDESPRFINGVLGRLVRNRPEVTAGEDRATKERGPEPVESTAGGSSDEGARPGARRKHRRGAGAALSCADTVGAARPYRLPSQGTLL